MHRVSAAAQQPAATTGRMESSEVTTWASASAWDTYRPTITHLYIERGKKLNDVMAIMAREHRFFGTRMYKSRLQRWGVRKNLSTQDVPELLDQVRKQSNNDPTPVVVRGRKVPPRRAEHYLRRTMGTCDGAEQVVKSNDVYHARCDDLAPRSLSLPDDMKLPDEVTLLLCQFVAGCCEGGRWCPDGNIPEFVADSKVNFWLGEINSAGYLVEQGRFQQGFQFLNVCFDRLKDILVAPDPRIFVYVYYTALKLPDQISRRLLEYAAEMCAVCLSAHHPLTRIWRMLCQADRQQLEKVGWSILRCYFDVLEERFAQSQYGMLNFARVFNRLALNLQFVNTETARSRQVDVVRGLERLGGCTNEVLHTKVAVADLFFQDAQYETALAYLGEIEKEIARGELTDPLGRKSLMEINGTCEKWRYAPTNYHYLYFQIYKATGMVGDAVKAGRDFMRSYITDKGIPLANAMENIRRVQLYFTAIGDHEEVNRLQQILDSGPDLEDELLAYFRDIDTANQDVTLDISSVS